MASDKRLTPLVGLLAALLLTTTAFAGTAAACQDPCEKPYAAFVGFESGGVTLHTQLGTQTIEIARGGDSGFAVSSTGTVEVDVAFACVEAYHVYVVKYGGENGNGLPLPPTVVYDQWVFPGCGSGVDTHSVPIGLDAGEYHFYLDWWDCFGGSGHDYRKVAIVDPPVPTSL